MKKTYINPQIQVVKIATAAMIALSASLDSTRIITDSDDFAARDGDFDDEE